jgi:hypothetical protein
MPEHIRPDPRQAAEPSSQLHELILSSIATYGEPEPNSQLAQRILQRIAAETRPVPPRRWLPWAVALAMGACLIAFFALFQAKPVHAPASVSNQMHIPEQADDNTGRREIATVAPHQSQHERRRTLVRSDLRLHATSLLREAQPLPKLDVFPMPQPLTPAERALIQFAERTPVAERKALIEAQQQPDTPLTIAAIKIQPIEMPELGN